MANRTSRTPEKDAAFLDTLRDGASVSASCLAAAYGRASVYEWREADEAFKAAWDDAADEGTDRMEDEAYRRAVRGTTKPVFQGGKRVGEVQEFSDTLMIFMLKGRRPEKFKDRSTVDMNAKVHVDAGSDFAEFTRAMETAAALKSGGTGSAGTVD